MLVAGGRAALSRCAVFDRQVYVFPLPLPSLFFFFNDTATTEIYTLSLHDALPIYGTTPGFDGSGDIAFHSDSYQVFMARGQTKKKLGIPIPDANGVLRAPLQNWGIKAPDLAPTLTTVAIITTTVASFDSTESLAFTINEGTTSFQNGHTGTANSALELIPNATTGRASAQKAFAADTDFLTISFRTGSDTDLFDCFVWIEEPKQVEKVTFMFGLGAGADPFVDDYYYFDFNIGTNTVDVKDATSAVAAATAKAAQNIQSILSPQDVTETKTPEQVRQVFQRLGRLTARSSERRDSLAASPAWTHFTVSRGQFNRVGGSPGRTWSTVRSFNAVYQAIPGSTKKIQFDDAVWYGGGDKALTGKYRCIYRWVNDNGTYLELSPASPQSTQNVITHPRFRITSPPAS